MSLLEAGKLVQIHVLGRRHAKNSKYLVSLDLLRPHRHRNTDDTALVLILIMVLAVIARAIARARATTIIVIITASTAEAWKGAWIV